MRAIVLTSQGDVDALTIEQRPDLQPGPGEVVVRVRAAALNRRDVFIRRGLYPGIKFPIVLGSDGAGEVLSLGEGVDGSWLGQPVIIDPSFSWGTNLRAQGGAFNILGLPRDGTCAEQVLVPAANLHRKPAALSWEEAAAVPLTSVTAFRALVTRAGLQAGERVVVTGIGGGVATAALTIAIHLGARVWVTSGSETKIALAVQHGAAGGVNHHSDDWVKTLVAQIGGRPDVIIDGAGGETFNRCLDLVSPGGRVVSYGATLGPSPKLEVRRIFWKQIDVMGSSMGTPADFAAMVALYDQGLRPIIDRVFPFDEARDAHARLEQGEQFGKIVVRC